MTIIVLAVIEYINPKCKVLDDAYISRLIPSNEFVQILCNSCGTNKYHIKSKSHIRNHKEGGKDVFISQKLNIYCWTKSIP